MLNDETKCYTMRYCLKEKSLLMLSCRVWQRASTQYAPVLFLFYSVRRLLMVILIITDGLFIIIYVDAYVRPIMEEVCLWPPQ